MLGSSPRPLRRGHPDRDGKTSGQGDAVSMGLALHALAACLRRHPLATHTSAATIPEPTRTGGEGE